MNYSGLPIITGKTKVGDSHLTRDEKLMDLLATYHPVTLNEEGNYSERLTWCLEHCQSKFRDVRESKTTAWYFQNEHDATMFAIRWSD